jgi:hypothetical protein
MESSSTAQYCQNCGQSLDSTARFCPSCGTAREAPQPGIAPTHTQAGPTHPPQYMPQQSGPSGRTILGWILAVLGVIIGIPFALVLLVVLARLLGIF